MKDEIRFQAALEIYRKEAHERYNIGTYNEKSLHRIIKYYIEPCTAFHEIKTGAYIADIRRGDEIFEIQTRGMYRLKDKLDAFLPDYSVTVIFPIAKETYLSWIDPDTYEISGRRKSPRRQNIFSALRELYPLRRFLGDENLHFKFMFFRIEEFNFLNGRTETRKKGATRYERVPTVLLDEIDYAVREDFLSLIPEGLPDPFTVKDFAKAAKVNKETAAYAVGILRELLLVDRCGKSGNSYLYKETGR